MERPNLTDPKQRDQALRLVVLSNLPMAPPPPGPIENARRHLDDLVAEGLAEIRDGLAHRTPAGDAALAEAVSPGMAPGGHDHVFPGDVSDVAIVCLRHAWPGLLVIDAGDELFVYRDQEALRDWDNLGATPETEGSMVHIITRDGQTTVVTRPLAEAYERRSEPDDAGEAEDP